MGTGFHNHQTEWGFIDGKRPMDVLAANTPKKFTLQLDVGTVRPDRGYRVLFGEGDSPWPRIFEAAESVGGVEYYLIEQEGSRFPEIETAQRCLATWKRMCG
jgi:sugar phosphate isomerase/epimerase